MASESSESCEKCSKMKADLDDVHAMLVSMETNHTEVVKELQRKYNDEVASMQTLLDEAAAEASSLTTHKFEQERNKLFENKNEMESEIVRLRRLVVEGARNQQQLEAQRSPEHRDSNLSANSVQMFEDEIEMLKIQLATANQEISKITLEKERLSQQFAASAEESRVAKEISMELVSQQEGQALAEKLKGAETLIQQLAAKLARAESDVNALRTSAAEAFERSKHELNKLREKFQSVVEVNRRLTFHYAKKSQEMREEEINLPPTFDELLTNALMLREQVILERANREVLKEKTSQEIDLLRSELQAEQNERQQMEQLLGAEIDSLRHELTKDRSTSRSKSFQNIQFQSSVSTDESNAHRKSVSVVPDPEVESLKQSKALLENEIHGLRQQCARLQVELDTSESVQQDLVRLSQSLQMSLEGLRDQSEVRWEFDDEVDQCRGCKKSLPVALRKQHCRHCGKIFCESCLSQTVPSGARRRPAQVCSQCHFLLVQDAKPYFTEVADQ